MRNVHGAALPCLLLLASGFVAFAQESQPGGGAAALARTRPFLSLLFGIQLDDADELTSVMSRLEKTLSPAEWTSGNEEWTPIMLRKAAALLGESNRGDGVADRWVAGRSLTWTGKAQPARQVAAGVIGFADAGAARTYIGLAVDLQRKQDELLNTACADGRRVVESRSLTVQLKGVDEAAGANKKLQREANGPTTTLTQVWVRQGNRIIELTWTGMEADLAWAQRVVDSLAACSEHPSPLYSGEKGRGDGAVPRVRDPSPPTPLP
jgi:hypothetical protein